MQENANLTWNHFILLELLKSLYIKLAFNTRKRMCVKTIIKMCKIRGMQEIRVNQEREKEFRENTKQMHQIAWLSLLQTMVIFLNPQFPSVRESIDVSMIAPWISSALQVHIIHIFYQ